MQQVLFLMLHFTLFTSILYGMEESCIENESDVFASFVAIADAMEEDAIKNVAPVATSYLVNAMPLASVEDSINESITMVCTHKFWCDSRVRPGEKYIFISPPVVITSNITGISLEQLYQDAFKKGFDESFKLITENAFIVDNREIDEFRTHLKKEDAKEAYLEQIKLINESVVEVPSVLTADKNFVIKKRYNLEKTIKKFQKTPAAEQSNFIVKTMNNRYKYLLEKDIVMIEKSEMPEFKERIYSDGFKNGISFNRKMDKILSKKRLEYEQQSKIIQQNTNTRRSFLIGVGAAGVAWCLASQYK